MHGSRTRCVFDFTVGIFSTVLYICLFKSTCVLQISSCFVHDLFVIINVYFWQTSIYDGYSLDLLEFQGILIQELFMLSGEAVAASAARRGGAY